MVLALIAGWTTTGLRSYIWQGLALDRIINWPAFVLDKLDPAKLPDPLAPMVQFVPPVCGQCEGRTGDPMRWRVDIVDGLEVPCPRCNPAGRQDNHPRPPHAAGGPAAWLAQALEACDPATTPQSPTPQRTRTTPTSLAGQ